MSQYGAQGAARLGCAYPRILATYYRGTHVAIAPMPRTVTVRMTENARWGVGPFGHRNRDVAHRRPDRPRPAGGPGAGPPVERDHRRARQRDPAGVGGPGGRRVCYGRSIGAASCGSTRGPTRTASSRCGCGGTGSSSGSTRRGWTPSRSSRTTGAVGRWTSTSSGWPRCRRAGPRRRSGPKSWRRGRSRSSAAGRCCQRSPTRTGRATTRKLLPVLRGATRCRRRAAASSSTGRGGRSTPCTRRRWPGTPRTRCTRGAETRSRTCDRSTTPAGPAPRTTRRAPAPGRSASAGREWPMRSASAG